MDGSDYQGEQCPQFGRAMHPYFGLDPGFANLNHGALGSVPRPVARAYERLSEQVEANPDRFMWFEYWPKLDEVRASVAKLIGASPDECVFVPNVSHGVNTVLRNFAWNKGDFIMITNCSFDTISGAAHNISDMPPHPTVSEFPLHFPESYSSMLSRFRDHLRSLKVKQAQSDGDASKKIVVIMDSVPCAPAVLMPWKEMIQICKEEGAWSLVDAAHSIGQEIGLDVTKAAPDFWISSCCKWLYAKRPCAVLYVPKRAGDLGHAHAADYQVRYVCDVVERYIASPVLVALSFRAFLGGEEKINAYCHQLALAGGRRMAEILGTSMMYSAEDEEGYNLNMANVELPIPSTIHLSLELMHTFQDKLINEHNTYSTQFYHNNKWWTRPSAKVFNEIEDFERLGRALVVVCKEITDKFGK
ncbi:hypothetical protein EVJ58_g4845 [Rhodofomes roseus]|uniref:Aminotransferase class V domain-containing protein n=1 Tax=Rhodofomes roseus TaxID=34475 RepID=A0A4Y9YGC9_9APHY|nr:hypothetical protein EVJ58_g4845 [Rhodofomes roseus]